eukprot:GILK01009542.1.p1 GENE.GILK01009542.1~~GILK01009542.1.p1  ORF type:complete len:309 (-),score=35.72 GILK01009542.1:159-1085(-)
MSSGNAIQDFLAGAFAPVPAVLATNPIEVCKTRLQIQGQSGVQVAYRGSFHALTSIVENEGIFALQKGIVPAIFFQMFFNGARLGSYDSLKESYSARFGSVPAVAHSAIGAFSGALGFFCGSPFHLIKVRMQAHSLHPNSRSSYNYTGCWDALTTIYRQTGVSGFFVGVRAGMTKVAIGSSFQLPSYDYAKSYLLSTPFFSSRAPILTHFGASLAAGFVATAAMNPIDVVSTRLCNQPTSVDANGRVVPALYKNSIDCFIKTVQTEGVASLYRGFIAHYLRVCPYVIITFLTWEKLKNVHPTHTHQHK